MLKFMIFLVFMLSAYASFQPKPRNDAQKVISEVIFELFTRHEIDFDFIMLGKSSRRFEGIFNEVLKLHGRGRKIFQVKNLREWKGRNALVMIEDVKFYSDDKILTSNPRPKILFFTPNFDDNWAWTQKFAFSYFIFESKEIFKLKTFSLWSAKACNVEQSLTLNVFDRKIQRWRNPLKIEEKFQNFHECPLRIFSGIYWLPIFDIFQDAGMTYLHPEMQTIIDKRNAKENEILKIFAKAGNFTAIAGKTRYDQNLQIIVTNGGLWAKAQCSMSVFQFTFLFTYSPPEPFTNYEKMLLPFDRDTWMYLIIIVCATFFGVIVMNRLRMMRRFMYENDRSMSFFNVVAILFGIGQTRLPATNFGRILLITFVFFCLTLRAAYQGVFFEMFTSEMLRSSPKTFADLKERNYTIYLTESPHMSGEFLGWMIQDSDRPKIQVIGNMEIFSIYKKLTNSSLKAVIPSTEVDLKVFRAGFTPRKILDERINFPSSGICVGHGDFYADQSQKVSNALISAGIVQYWYSYLLDFEIKPVEEAQKEPKVFAIEDLSFGFIVWLVACGISAIGFAAEWIFFGLSKMFHEVIPGLFAVLYVVRFATSRFY